jgi:hypothetical protein
LPEAHAIYWAAQGLEAAKRNERKINPDDLITLRRVIYQSMQLSFQRGRLIVNKADRQFEFGPNLAIIPKVNAAYEQAMEEDPKNRDHIQTAHRNMIRDVVFFYYTYNRLAEAAQWYKYLSEKYPDKTLLDNTPTSLPRNLTVDEYSMGRIQEEVDDTSHDKTRAVLEGLERTALLSLAVDEEDRYLGYEGMAHKIWARYSAKVKGDPEKRIALLPLPEIRQDVLKRLLDNELSVELANALRTKLGLPAAQPSTNALPTEAISK